MRQRQTGQADKLGIYIHIPFCRSKCDYCDFYSLAGREDRMDAYQKALLAHIRETAPLAQGIPVDTVYFGVGTPSWYGARRIQELLSAYLQQAGYQTSLAGDGVEALELFRSASFDLVLLDIMLPKIDGFGVCELIRQESQVPILMLTALDGEAEQLRGFDLEIDDYVTKPFSMPVLLKKIAAILRRAGGISTAPSLLRYGDLTLDPEAMEVRLAGRSLELTAREFELLHTFLSSPGRVFTREVLLAKLWGYDFFGDERVVDSHIKNLRHKLGIDCIETVRGVGYRAAKEAP